MADDGDAVFLVDAAQRVHHDGRVAQIERRDRLVGEQDLRLLHERARDRDALLLAAGQFVGPMQRVRHHVEPLQRADRERAVLRRRTS